MASNAKTLKMAFRSDITSFDPVKQDDVSSTNIALQVYEGLFGYNSRGDIVSVLITDWDLAPDKITYNFHLKSNVKFSNGKDLNAYDVKYSFERNASKESINSWAVKLIEGYEDFVSGRQKDISGIIVSDPHHLQIKLKEPHQPFLALLASVYYKVVAVDPLSDGSIQLVGTGPYKIDEYIPKQKVVLSHNGYYHSKLNNIDKIEIHILPYNEAHNRFNSGELDMLKQYPEGPSITNTDTKKMTAYQYTVWYNLCNLEQYPCNNENFRKALYYAVDREEFVKKIGGGTFLAKGYI